MCALKWAGGAGGAEKGVPQRQPPTVSPPDGEFWLMACGKVGPAVCGVYQASKPAGAAHLSWETLG